MTLLLWIEVGGKLNLIKKQKNQTVFRCFDLDADNYISYEEYIKGMSVFLKGKYEEKLRCKSFNVYFSADLYYS